MCRLVLISGIYWSEKGVYIIMLAKIKMSLKTFPLIIVAILISCKEDTRMLLQRAGQLLDKGKYKEAIEVYNKALAQNSRIQSAYLERGYCYLKTKEFQRL